MFDLICVTNRSLCQEDFKKRIEKIAAAKPKAIILREKDLDDCEYEILARDIIAICEKNNVECILHSFSDIAKMLNHRAIHLPMHILKSLDEDERSYFKVLGASCHSVDEAVEAEKLGCTYITAGHIFETECKKDLPGRGIDFLKSVCQAVSIPVYAIGGIDFNNVDKIKSAGASGACVMSSLMKCENPKELIEKMTDL